LIWAKQDMLISSKTRWKRTLKPHPCLTPIGSQAGESTLKAREY